MSESKKQKTHLGKLFVATFTACNMVINPFLHHYSTLDPNILNAISPIISSIVAYLLVTFVFTHMPSLDEADTQRKLKKINTALQDENLTEKEKEILRSRYVELKLGDLE